MKFRVIWDDCTPTRDRRPTTLQDIEEDIHVKDFEGSEDDFLDLILDIVGWDRDELEDNEIEGTPIEQAQELIGYCNDPGDGSANFLYVSVDGKELDGSFPYDGMENLDLEHCTEKEVKKLLMSEYSDIFDDWD